MAKNIMEILTLRGKDIWVFGGAGYLGQAVVHLLSAAGAKVLCVDLEDRAHAFVKSGSLEDLVTPGTLNVTDEQQMKRFVSEQIKERGTPQGCVDLTSHFAGKKLEDLTAGDFDKANHGALTSVFLLVREIGMRMSEAKQGSIVLFSSMYGMVSPDPDAYKPPMNKNPIEYGMGKAGLIQMARYLAVHWGKDNVRCNCISPGPFPNPSVQKNYPDFIKHLSQNTPLERIGRSEEIAGAVAFLLSDAASYITGHNLVVDGGWTIW